MLANKHLVFKIFESWWFSDSSKSNDLEPLGNTSLLCYISANRTKIHGLWEDFSCNHLGEEIKVKNILFSSKLYVAAKQTSNEVTGNTARGGRSSSLGKYLT